MAQEGSKTIGFLVAAIVLGLVAALAGGAYLKSKEKARLARLGDEPEEQLVRVVTVKQNVPGGVLPKGVRIRGDFFDAELVPARFAPPAAVQPAEFGNVNGKFLQESLAPGQVLMDTFLDETFPVDFSDLIEQGRRAVTITVDEVNSIGGHIRPGNKVDVFVRIGVGAIGAEGRFQQVGTGAAEVSEVILPVLQNVQVLATGEAAYDETLDELYQPQRTGGRRFTNVTLDVSPQEGALLKAAVERGDPVAMLRNRRDETYADFTLVTAADLLTHAREMEQQAVARAAAAATGGTVNENGDLVLPDGTVVRKEDIVVSENGAVTTRGGKVLGGNGIRMNENGDYVDEDGNVIEPEDVVVGPDGTVKTKDQMMAELGYTKNADGDYVDEDGNVVRKEDVQVLDNGSVMAGGQTISGPQVTRTKDGFLVDENGNVMTADGQVLEGVRVNEAGDVVTGDGRVLKDPNLRVADDGSVTDASGEVIAGVRGGTARRPAAAPETGADVFDQMAREFLEGEGEAIEAGAAARLGIDLIVGGSGKDGIAPIAELPILD